MWSLFRYIDAVNEQKLDKILSTLSLIRKDLAMALQTLAGLQAAVANDTTVEQSAITLLNGLSAQIAALKTTQTDPATAAAIDALATQVTTNSTALSAAVTANTPAPAAS